MTTKYHDETYTAKCSEKTLQSNERGFFMQFVEHVVQNVGDDWIEEVFGKLKDDRERVRIIYEFEQVRNVVTHTLSHVQEIYRKKSAEVSQARRLEGEKAYKNGDYKRSLMMYSQSVLRAPSTKEDDKVDNGISLALALWGRSEVLLALNEYTLALKDIQYALKEELPTSFKADAFWRMGICYKGKGELDRAKVSFGIMEKLLPDDKRKLDNLKTHMEKEYHETKKKSRKSLPSITGSRHQIYQNASKKIRVKEEKGYGRFVVAGESIKTGETIVVEPPYSACLLPDYFGTHCHHCFERLVSPVGCPTCSNVAFCKAECRDSALSQYHKYECKYLDLLIGSGMSILSHTALRMITQNSLDRCMDIYEDRTLESIYSLCTHSAERSASDFFQRTLMSCFLLRCLQRSGYFGPNRTDDDCMPKESELRVAELLLFHLQILQFNAHEIYETRHDSKHRFKSARATYIGVAIYPTVSLFNHDCYPGVTRHFVGKHIVITAVRPIAPGSPISENYGPVFMRRTLANRQKSLSGRYWFTCSCDACKQDWPSLDTGIERVPRKIKCPNGRCTFNFTLPITNETMKCPRCKRKVSLTENLMKLRACEEQFQRAIDLMEAQEPQSGMEVLKDAIELFHKVSVPPHRDVHLGQELLRTFLADSGNVYECPTREES